VKETGILFSGPMVRAIREDRKTQTRRVIKPQPYFNDRSRLAWKCCGSFADPVAGKTAEEMIASHCPYGGPGDRLWVRETWRTSMAYDQFAPSQIDSGAPVLWVADNAPKLNGPQSWGKLRPYIFMPRWASRITLEIVSVRVQRLQAITEADAIAEGVVQQYRQAERVLPGASHAVMAAAHRLESPRGAFAVLWDSINLDRGHGWARNDWVWAVEFKRIETKGGGE